MRSTSQSDALEHVRRSIGMPIGDLWLASFSLGSMLSLSELTDVLCGAETSAGEYSVISAALDEAAADANSPLRVPEPPL